MKKLLSISTDRSIFSEGSAVRKRMVEYAKDWDEIHVIVASSKSFTETSIAPNVWVYPTRSAVKILYPLDARRLGRFIIGRRGITHMTCQDPFFTAMAGVALKKEFKLPLEIQVHTDIGSVNYPKSISNRFRKALAVSYLPQADAIRVVSARIKDFLVEKLRISESKITIRPIAVNVEAIRVAPLTADLHKKYPQFSKIVLMASRLTEEKNISMAIKAWKKVAASDPQAGLIIVGSGPKQRELKCLISRLGLVSSVIMEPWADLQTLYSYYKTADVFLNTSLFEGYGMTLVEANAAGRKIVSTDVGVAREVGAIIVDWTPADIERGIRAALGV